MIASPIFGRKNVPNMLKIGFCAVLTLVFLRGLKEPDMYPVYTNLAQYTLICICELLFGAVMGYTLTVMFNLTLTAGGIMDYQIGFTMAGIYDAQAATQSSLTGSLLNYLLLINFFAVNGHLKLVDILYKTMDLVPIGYSQISPAIMYVAAEVVSKSFLLSVMVSMPVLAAGMVLEMAMGILIRTVPQLNMFIVGIPLKIVVGLTIMILSMTLFNDFLKDIFNMTFNYMGTMFEYMRSGV